VVLLAVGCLGVGNRWPRNILLAALALLVVAEVGFRAEGDDTGDLLRLVGGVGIGLSLWVAARRSLATKISAVAGVLLVVVVLILSGALSTVLTDNVSEQALKRASSRAELEAELISEQADDAVGLAGFLARIFETSGGAREAIKIGDIAALQAILSGLQQNYTKFDFLAFFGPDQNLMASSLKEGAGVTILQNLAGSATVQEAFQGTLSAAAGGIETTSNDGLVAVGIDLIEFPDDRGTPTQWGALALGSFINDRYLSNRRTGDDRQESNLTIIIPSGKVVTNFPGGLGEERAPLDGEADDQLLVDVFDKKEAPQGTGTFRDEDILYAVEPIPGPADAPRAAVVVSLAGSVVADAQASLFRTLFLVALGAAAIALALAAFAGSRLGGPLRRLAGVAEQISQGDLTVRSGLRSADEIGLLGGSFDEMAGSIERMTGDLRESQAQMEAVLHSMADGLVAASPLGLVSMMNPAAEQMLGVRASREIGKPVASVLRARDRSGGSLDDRFEMPDFQAWRAVGTVQHRDQQLPVALAGAPIRNESGGVLGAVYVMRDLRPEMEIERAKTEFLSNISHEMRTPLTPIKAYAGMLKRDLNMPEGRRLTPERVDNFLEEILESSERLERTIDILVSFAQMEAGKLVLRHEMIDVPGLVTEVCARWRSRVEKHRVEELVSDRPRVMADRKLLERSLDELIDNAIKFSPKGGAVSVRAHIVGEGDGRSVEFSVTDQGIGISPENMDNMFKEFIQGDGTATRAYGGLGLGLPFVQRVVKAHGGRIDASSEPGRGSTFEFQIPIAGNAAASGTGGVAA
jgi:PAS domain S-box-containing protein